MVLDAAAAIELVNENDLPIQQYFYIDYELYPEEHPEDTLYFHALWNRGGRRTQNTLRGRRAATAGRRGRH
jgi:hypothetical protein